MIKSKDLITTIYSAEAPEVVVKSLPAQTLYYCIKDQGLESSVELIMLATLEQTRTFLDLDLWNKDKVSEENFFSWLLLDDDEGGLSILQKILKVIDLKVLSLILSAYVTVETNEEPTDAPPAPGFYTPDQGHTWILISHEDPDKFFALGRILALLFETSPEVFYQVLSIPTVSTPSALEEDSYQDKLKRLAAEGIPDLEFASEVISPKKIDKFKEPKSELKASAGLLVNFKDDDREELALILNALVVHFNLPFYEIEQIKIGEEFIVGCINIALEKASSSNSIRELFQEGLYYVLELRRKALKLKDPDDSIMIAILDELRKLPPLMPCFIRKDGTIIKEGENLVTGSKAIQHSSELVVLENFLGATSSTWGSGRKA